VTLSFNILNPRLQRVVGRLHVRRQVNQAGRSAFHFASDLVITPQNPQTDSPQAPILVPLGETPTNTEVAEVINEEEEDVEELEKIDTNENDNDNEADIVINQNLNWKDISRKALAPMLVRYGLDINALERVIVTQHRRAVDVADPKKLVQFIEQLIGGQGAQNEIEALSAEYVAAENEAGRLDDEYETLVSKSEELNPALQQWKRFNESKLEYHERLATVCKKRAVLLEKESVAAGKEAEEAEKKLESYETVQETARIKADELLAVKETADAAAEVAVAQHKNSLDQHEAALEQLERAKVRNNAATTAAKRASSSLGMIIGPVCAEHNLEKTTKAAAKGRGAAAAAAEKVKELLENKAEILESEVNGVQEEVESFDMKLDRLETEENSDESISSKVLAARKAWNKAQQRADAAAATAEIAAKKASQAAQDASTAVFTLENKEKVEHDAQKAVEKCNNAIISLEDSLVTLEKEEKHVLAAAEKAENDLAAHQIEGMKLEKALEKASKTLEDAGIDENEYISVPSKDTSNGGGGGSRQSVDAAVAALAQQAQHDELNPLTGAFHGRIHSVVRLLSSQALPAVNAVLLEICNPAASLVTSTRTAAEAVVEYFKENKVGVACCIVLEELNTTTGTSNATATTKENSATTAAEMLAPVLSGTPGALCPLSPLIQARNNVAGSSLLCSDLFDNWYLVSDPLAAAKIREQEKKEDGGGNSAGKNAGKQSPPRRSRRNLVTLCGSLFKFDGEICAPKENTFLKLKEKYLLFSEFIEIGSSSTTGLSSSGAADGVAYETMVENLQKEHATALAAVDFHELSAEAINERTAAAHAALASKHAAISTTKSKIEAALKTMQKETKILHTAQAAVEKALIDHHAATAAVKNLHTASLEAASLSKQCTKTNNQLHQVYVDAAKSEPAAQKVLEKEETVADLRSRVDEAEKRKLALETQLDSVHTNITRLDTALLAAEKAKKAAVEAANTVSTATTAVTEAEEQVKQAQDAMDSAAAAKKLATKNWRETVKHHQSALQTHQETLASIDDARHRQQTALGLAIEISRESVDAMQQVTIINEKLNSAGLALRGFLSSGHEEEEERKKIENGNDDDDDDMCSSTSSSDLEIDTASKRMRRGGDNNASKDTIPAARGGVSSPPSPQQLGKKTLEAAVVKDNNECSPSSSDGAVSVQPMESTESEWEEDEVTSALSELAKQNRELEKLALDLNTSAASKAIEVYSKLVLMYRKLQYHDDKVQRLAMRLAEARTARYTRFSTAMNAAAVHLTTIYERLTGDIGDASCYYSQNEHTCFEEGVKFKVRPDSGSWRMVSQLSGGQQALAALSLCFAFQKISPSPFYFFDEIDAALDIDASQRVADFLRDACEGSGSTGGGPQIIAVSHRTAPQEAAHCLLAVFPIQQLQEKNSSSSIKTGIMTLHPSFYRNEYDLHLQDLTGQKRLVRLDDDGKVYIVEDDLKERVFEDDEIDYMFIKEMIQVLTNTDS
jgi:hypothetical protein